MLGLIHRNLISCSPRVKEAAYKSLVLLRLEYCASIWDPFHKKDLTQLEAVQRRAARFVVGKHSKTHSVSSIITKLGWSALEECRMIARLSLLYKSVHHKVAINSDHLRHTPSTRTGMHTRTTETISFLRDSANKDCFKYSFFPRTTAEWNLLPVSVREAPSLTVFKDSLRKLNLLSIKNRAHYN